MAGPTSSSETSIQSAVFQLEMGRGKRVIQWVLLVLLAAALSLIYTAGQFRGLNKRESMDMAQLARNIAHGQGFTTYLIRPLSIWKLEQNGWNIQDKATRERLIMNHPDTCNPPLYPLMLAGLFKMLPEKAFEYDTAERVYPPERWIILPFDQICLLASVLIVFLWAKRLFDRRVAAVAGLLMLFSDTLWSYGVSGLPTNLLMLLFLLAIYCLFLADSRLNPPEPAEGEPAAPPSRVTAGVVALVVGSAAFLGLCFLTRYLSAFFLIPITIYVARIFRGRAAALWAGVYVAVFAAIITPWLVRNVHISGSLLGLAQYELIDRSGSFHGEILPRSYKPDFTGAYAMRSLTGKFLVNLRPNLLTNLRLIGSDFLIFFFGVGLMYGFRRRDVTGLRRFVVGAIAIAIFAMSLIGSAPERTGPDVNGGNLLVILLPLVAMFGTAFFYLLLDRIRFRLRLTKALAVGAFAVLNVAPMILTILPPRPNLFPYPPYIPPVERAVAKYFEADALACSDLPWAIAWDSAQRALWLPMTMDDLYEINDFVAPKGIQYMMLTPYLIDARPQTEIAKGEFKGWMTFMRGQVPSTFPLKAYSALPPDDEQILLADRVRWSKKKTEGGESESNVITVPGVTNTVVKPALSSTNRPPQSSGGRSGQTSP